MAHKGWKQLIDGWPWFRGEGHFPLWPDSEFMPPIRLVRRPYGTWDSVPVSEDDPWGWPISEYEEILVLRPGLRYLANRLFDWLLPLCRGEAQDTPPEHQLKDNPYWPKELAKHAPTLKHERFVLLLPLALSLTQDDKANVRWTLFGNSEQPPGHAFWKGFFTAPTQEVPAEQALDFFRTLLARAYNEPKERLADLRQAGFRIMPVHSAAGQRHQEPLPSWTRDYLLDDGASLSGVNYVLTFRPFRDLPLGVRRKYFAGALHLLPFPGSLLFWGISLYQELARHLRLATQVPLLHIFERHDRPGKMRIPQSGWFEENDGAGASSRGLPMRGTYQRTHRTARVHRYENYLVSAREHHLSHVLFSTRPEDVSLYHKPMARNIQLWTQDFQPLLDGPRASIEEIRSAAHAVDAGGLFGYRFLFPAMCVGRHELYWHRPLVAFLDGQTKRPRVFERAPLGYFTAYPENEPDLGKPIELWPRLLEREVHQANVKCFHALQQDPPRKTIINVRKLLDAWERSGRQPLPRSFARQLLTIDKRQTLEGWLRRLPAQSNPAQKALAQELTGRLQGCLAAEGEAVGEPATALTFDETATRDFEQAYWDQIAFLSAGAYVNKNNADCVLDKPTQEALQHFGRDLDNVGNYLLDYYARLTAERGMTEQVRIGELPFHWQTQYAFPWMGGWLHNQEGKCYERNLLIMIPGRDRSRAVVMADHYDTAFMYDRYERIYGGSGARLAAPGADDNGSATAALMLGARSFLSLSQQNRLACDVWLLHLTGEEYPAEGQGACRMCQWLVEGNLTLHTMNGKHHDLSRVHLQGLYVLDMIAHNNRKDRDVFQIAPGASPEALWLAQQAQLANQLWNQSTPAWNRRPVRRAARRAPRCRDGKTIPPVSPFLPLHGEVRPHFDPRSTLFNTDGQMFSDIGVPVVLFMENYDIDRVGYHDTHDNMTNIDLDYGAALAAITIETVARAASIEPPLWALSAKKKMNDTSCGQE